MIEIASAVVMVLVACLFMAGAGWFMYRKLAEARPPISYSIYHRDDAFAEECRSLFYRDPPEDDTDRFIREMDEKLNQPDPWRYSK